MKSIDNASYLIVSIMLEHVTLFLHVLIYFPLLFVNRRI